MVVEADAVQSVLIPACWRSWQQMKNSIQAHIADGHGRGHEHATLWML
jgi:hypothetical protein